MIEIIPNWHPIFVHFTITLVTFAGIIQCVIWIRSPAKESPIRFAQKWTNIFGLAAILATVLSGYHAYMTVEHDAVSHAAMSVHRNWALVTLFIFAAGAVLSLSAAKRYMQAGGILLVIALGLVTITGYKGGELVYRYGVGVLSLPNTDGSEHSHGDEHMIDNSVHHGAIEINTLEESGHHHDDHSH